jgi:hypothetical protein
MTEGSMESTDNLRPVAFPSDQLPAFASFTFKLPDGWNAAEQPGCIGVFVEPSSGASFRANLVVDVERVAGAIELAQLARELLETDAAQQAEFALVDEKVLETSDGAALLRATTFCDPRVADPIGQITFLALAPLRPGAATRDLVQLTASFLARDLDRFASLMGDVGRSVAFAPRV